MKKNVVILTLSIFLGNCASNTPEGAINLSARFNQGKAFLEDEKYLRAQEEFQYVVIRGTGSDLGDDAQFYLGESYYLNKEYLLAISEYEKLVRKMGFSPYIERARYRICEAYNIESPEYYLDQTYSQKALERYQEFIEDFPQSIHVQDALDAIKDLRNKMAFKVYETGILYIKMEEYVSAILAFEQLIENYYDTEYAENAHYGIIHSYILKGDLELAQTYWDTHNNKVQSSELRIKALKEISTLKHKSREDNG